MGEGGFTSQIFEGKYEAKLELPEGWECKPNNLLWEGYLDILWNTGMCTLYPALVYNTQVNSSFHAF